jgi:hypothetical protein
MARQAPRGPEELAQAAAEEPGEDEDAADAAEEKG